MAYVGFQFAGYAGANVANRIRELRLERAQTFPAAFSAAALARRLGVTDWTMRAWEAGRVNPTARHARALARELNVSLEGLGLDHEADDARGPASQ